MEDKYLKKFVEDELQYQPSIDAADIGVTVENGIVHLTGHVQTYAQKVTVENTVKRIRGVRGYVEDIAVRVGADLHSDDAIAGRVAALLEWDVTVPKGSIKPKVEEGYVTLSGEVDWAYQRNSAEAAIRRLAGVRGVTNRITVKPRAQSADIKRRIEQALERQARLEADHIAVTVDGSKVKLNGKVRAWYERELVERAAWAAPGVQSVDDRITVGS